MEARVSRRAVLRSGVAFAAAVAAAGAASELLRGGGGSLANKTSESPVAAAARLLRAASGEARDLVRSTFVPHVGSTFHMTQNGRSRRAVLSEVNDLPTAATNDERQFALVFTTHDGGPASQGLFGFTHAQVGTMGLFAVPGDRTAAGQRYYVVVNRQHP